MGYKIKDREIYKDGHRLYSFGVAHSNMSVMDKELLLTVGRHFHELKGECTSYFQTDILNGAFLGAVEGPASHYLGVKETVQLLASYLALKDDRLEALHEVIGQVEEAAKNLKKGEK